MGVSETIQPADLGKAAERIRTVCGTDRRQAHQDLRDAADEIERLLAERDEARREVLLWVKERCSWVELTAEIKTRGWEYLKEASDDRSKR